jgi:hypothetical protein
VREAPRRRRRGRNADLETPLTFASYNMPVVRTTPRNAHTARTTGADGRNVDLEMPLTFANYHHTKGFGESIYEQEEPSPAVVSENGRVKCGPCGLCSRRSETRSRGYSVEDLTATALRGNGAGGRALSDDAIDPDLRERLAQVRRQGWSLRGVWGWVKHIGEATYTSSSQLYYERAELNAVRDVMLTGHADAVLQLLQSTETNMKALGRGLGAWSVPAAHTATEIETCWQQARGSKHARWCLFENRALAEYMEARVEHVRNSPASFIFEASWKAQEDTRMQEALPPQWSHPQPSSSGSWSSLEPEPEPEPALHSAGGHLSRELSIRSASTRDPSTLVASLINRYGRASDKAMVRLGTEIARLDHLIDTKYDINMKLTAAAFSLVFMYGQSHGDGSD